MGAGHTQDTPEHPSAPSLLPLCFPSPRLCTPPAPQAQLWTLMGQHEAAVQRGEPGQVPPLPTCPWCRCSRACP